MSSQDPVTTTERFDAIVIGGGFYGCVISVYLARQRGLGRVLLIEREAALMQRASYTNQARVHNGYHYPRSFTTAYRSRINLPRFVQDWPDAVVSDFTKVYAIARGQSKVTARQFVRFCHEIGARLDPAPPAIRSLFESRLIEDVFLVQEYAFDTTRLADWARNELAEIGADVRLYRRVQTIERSAMGLEVCHVDGAGVAARAVAPWVFNCTYSGLNQFGGDFQGTLASLKHEITEMVLMRPPAALANLGITVMDGPYFSMMPFPARGLHTLSHVRYTPHRHWFDMPGEDPYDKLRRDPPQSRTDRMVRDTARYLPAVLDAVHVDSLFEVKTVLRKSEGDDGRPIFFERHSDLPGCYSILGGKIDNIYDILEKLDQEPLVRH
ncbi:MAG: FAD-dependent oxidoreductase [Leptothrix sp. (in: b-proteobacteria)]